MRNRKTLVDWRRNNKISCRNFSEPNDKHDVIKLLLVRLLRRKHQDSHSNPIYTEYDFEDPNVDYPDVWMRISGENKETNIYVWEIQNNLTSKWTKEINKRYENFNLIVVPMKKLSDNIEELKVQLQDYLI